MLNGHLRFGTAHWLSLSRCERSERGSCDASVCSIWAVAMNCVVYDGGADDSILSLEREGQPEWNNHRSNGSSNGM